MLRTVIYLLASIFIIALLRVIIGVIMKGVGDLLEPSGGEGPTANVPTAGELKRDPVCGTYIAASSSVKRLVNGKTLHFCSEVCSAKYQA